MKKGLKICLIFLLFLITGLTIWFFNAPVYGVGDGESMQPTIMNGQTYSIDTSLTPKEGDIIAFNCSSTACQRRNIKMLCKRLIKIREDGAWWVEGDNKSNSWDSIDFGWILPNERSNVGVVKL
jgi:signal peptidase I